MLGAEEVGQDLIQHPNSTPTPAFPGVGKLFLGQIELNKKEEYCIYPGVQAITP